MRRFLYGLGIFFAVVLVAAVVGFFFLVRNGSALDAESKAYVDDAVIAISSHWSKDELLKRGSPQLLARATPKDLDTLFEATTVGLGPLVEYQGATRQSWTSMAATSGTTVVAIYVAQARYQKGDATIRLNLIKTEGKWSIQGFYVDSTAMMGNLVGHRS